MTITEGADADALERLAHYLDNAGTHLDEVYTQIKPLIASSSWAGHDADRFSSEWDGPQRRRLHMAARALHGAATSLRRNAAEQRRASDSYGSGSGGVGSHPGGPGRWPGGGLGFGWPEGSPPHRFPVGGLGPGGPGWGAPPGWLPPGASWPPQVVQTPYGPIPIIPPGPGHPFPIYPLPIPGTVPPQFVRIPILPGPGHDPWRDGIVGIGAKGGDPTTTAGAAASGIHAKSADGHAFLGKTGVAAAAAGAAVGAAGMSAAAGTGGGSSAGGGGTSFGGGGSSSMPLSAGSTGSGTGPVSAGAASGVSPLGSAGSSLSSIGKGIGKIAGNPKAMGGMGMGMGMMGMGMGMGMGGMGGGTNAKEMRRVLGDLDEFGSDPGTVWIDGALPPGNGLLGAVTHVPSFMKPVMSGSLAHSTPPTGPHDAASGLLAGMVP